MIASFPMYQRPELNHAHHQFWTLIRKNLKLDSPEYLSQDADEMAVWNDPKLVLSQTCGMPYRKFLHDHVTLIGTPDYGIEGCPPGYYKSVFIINKDERRTEPDDFKDALFAYNDINSQSGFHVADNFF